MDYLANVEIGQMYMYGGRSNTVSFMSFSHLVLEWTDAVVVDRQYGKDVYGKPYYIISIEKFNEMRKSNHPLNPKLKLT